MVQVKINDYLFEVDTEATKKHYKNFTFTDPNSQCVRNYHKFCDKLSDNEKDFINMFGIDPRCCNVIVPKDRQKEARHFCFSANAIRRGFLWEAFAYSDAACKFETEAKQYFEANKSDKAVLLMNNEEVAFFLENAKNILVDDLDSFDDMPSTPAC